MRHIGVCERKPDGAATQQIPYVWEPLQGEPDHYRTIPIVAALVVLSTIACATEYQPTPVPQPNATGCSIGGRPVSCDAFRDHTINESIADFAGLDCDAMANIAVSRFEGWALAESMGRVSYKEAESASTVSI